MKSALHGLLVIIVVVVMMCSHVTTRRPKGACLSLLETNHPRGVEVMVNLRCQFDWISKQLNDEPVGTGVWDFLAQVTDVTHPKFE